MGGCDRAVVEETKAAGEVAVGVMTRRTAECVSRSPGAGADRTGRIDRVPAETADNVRRVSRGVADGMDVGDHLGAAIPKLGPGVPCLGEKTEIFRTMDPCPRPLPENIRRNQVVLARLEPREQPVSAFGLLGGALDDAANQKELRVVASMQFGIDSLHANTPVEEKSLSSRQHCASQSGRAIIGPTWPTPLPINAGMMGCRDIEQSRRCRMRMRRCFPSLLS